MSVGVWLGSAPLEGVPTAADWARWIRLGRAPDARDGVGFAERWAEDLELLAGHGLTELALEVPWAAVEPERGRHDEVAWAAVRDRFVRAKELGLAPWAVLVDGTLPGWFADDEGGFGDDRARSLLWPRHVDTVGERLGDLVAGWVAQREPLRRVVRGHLLGIAPPGRRDAESTATGVRDALLADLEAWRLLAETAPIAASVTARLVVADDRTGATGDGLTAAKHTRVDERLWWAPAASMLVDGRIEVPNLAETELDGAAGRLVDRVIATVRPTLVVGADGGWRSRLDRSEMVRALVRATETFDELPVIGSADLAGVAADGQNRPDHLRALMEVTEATGWWQADPIDGWAWEHGFRAGTGVFDADRNPRPELTAFSSEPGRSSAN